MKHEIQVRPPSFGVFVMETPGASRKERTQLFLGPQTNLRFASWLDQ